MLREAIKRVFSRRSEGSIVELSIDDAERRLDKYLILQNLMPRIVGDRNYIGKYVDAYDIPFHAWKFLAQFDQRQIQYGAWVTPSKVQVEENINDGFFQNLIGTSRRIDL